MQKTRTTPTTSRRRPDSGDFAKNLLGPRTQLRDTILYGHILYSMFVLIWCICQLQSEKSKNLQRLLRTRCPLVHTIHSPCTYILGTCSHLPNQGEEIRRTSMLAHYVATFLNRQLPLRWRWIVQALGTIVLYFSGGGVVTRKWGHK